MREVLGMGIAYLLGAIPFGLILARAAGGFDVRRRGSGNIGATNVARSLGLGAGAVTLLLDVGKGAAAVGLGRAIAGTASGAALAGLAAIIGHTFPIYLRFRGGKGVATGVGVFLLLAPKATLVAAGVFAGILLGSRRVSAGSLGAAVALPVILAVRGTSNLLLGVSLLSSALIIIRHRQNLQNLWHGREPRLGERTR